MNTNDKTKLELSIRQQFHEFEGIIDSLRHNYFDKPKYLKFYKTLERYYETIKEDSTIDREIAGYLQTFHVYLYSVANCREKTLETMPNQKELDEAWSETLDLILKFYPEA